MEDARRIRRYIEERYWVRPEEIRSMLQKVMAEDLLNGFGEDIALPDVIFPEEEMQHRPTQAQLLYEAQGHDKSEEIRTIAQQNEDEGRVYWLTGLSGAGKTTIGRLWYETLKSSGETVVFLDGDELREAIGDGLGYTEADRRRSAMRNARLCALLARQGLTVVCCTISMFDSVREWNRENIPGYFEVYIKASMETLRRRDQKGLYSREKQDVAGVHFQVEEPKDPNLILENDGQKTPEEQTRILMKTVFKEEKQQ